LTQTGTLKSVSYQTATIAVHNGAELPDRVVLFLPGAGEMYRQCNVAARRIGEIDVSLGLWRHSFQDSLVQPIDASLGSV
jgi:hypothetical protein